MKKALTLFASLCFMGVQLLWAQTVQIKGTVTSAEDGSPIPGASVVVKGTTVGTMTDAEGKFELNVPQGTNALIISFVGLKTVEVKLEGKTIINIALEADVLGLDEVVVTALGLSREKKALGYSVSDVSGDDINNSGETNIIQSLASKASGVQVISSAGTPGASSKILIRGNSTFTGENQPLIIIDGIPIDNSTDGTVANDYPYNANLQGVNNTNRAIDINPDDIESVTVLKGPSAAALYGVRAGNGVIIYTTKKGKAGKGQGVNAVYSFDYGMDQVSKLPKLSMMYAQGNGGGGWNNTTNTPTVGVYDVADYGPDYTIDTDDDVSYGTPNSWGPKISDVPGLKATDNLKEFFQTGITKNHNLALTGGNESSSFRLSLGQYDQTGVVPNTSFTRTSVRISSDSYLSSKIKIGGTANYIKSGGNKAQNGSNLAGIMLALTRCPASYDLNDDEFGYEFPNGQQRSYFYAYDNPYWSAYNNIFKDEVDRLLGNVYLNYNPLNWIEVSYKIGVDAYTDKRKSFFEIGSNQPPEPTGELEENIKRNREIYSDLLIKISKDFTDDLSTILTLGNNLDMIDYQNLYGRGRGLSIPKFPNMSNASNLYSDEYSSHYRTAALFLLFSADFKKFVYLDITGRQEWASTFGTEKKHFFYPSVSLSVLLSELLPKNNILSFAKLRANYAEVGINPPLYSSKTYYTAPFYTDGFTNGYAFPYLGVSGFSLSTTLGNLAIKPERKKGFEFGLDLRFLNGKANIDVTYYNQTTSDIIVYRPIAGSTGFQSFISNSGTMRNNGIELELKLLPIDTKNFDWELSGTWSKNKNEVLALAEGVEEIDLESAFTSIGTYAIVGKPYGALYATMWERTSDGQLIINPNNGRPIVAAERGNIGNPFPDWLAGIRNTFTFKGLRASALIDIRQGGMVWCGTIARLNRIGRTEASNDRERRFIVDGVYAEVDGSGKLQYNEDGTVKYTNTPNTTEITALNYWGFVMGDNAGATENAVFDGSWVRLREVSLSYSFDLSKKIKYVKFIDVNLIGRNLWLKTDYPGVDPETSLTGAGSNLNGFDYFNMPGSKSINLGFKLGL